MCTYLDQVGSTYYFRRIVPDELRPYLLTATGKPRAEFKISLRTKDRAEAKGLLPDYVKMTDRVFDEARSKLAIDAPTEATAEPIDGGWLGEFAQEQAEFAARQDAERQRRRAERRHHRDEWREQLKYSTAQMPPRYAALKDLIREQEERAAAAEARLAAMQPIAASNPVEAPRGSVWLDGAVTDGWAAERKPKQKGIDTHRAVARWLYDRIGRKPVDQITREDVLTFKSKLLEEGQTAANIKQKLSRLRTLLQWATDNGYATTNVAHGITIKDTRAAKNKRKPFDLPALNAIFSSPVFAKGERPTQGRGEAAYWIPLLALFTGARMEELGQLRPSDVVQLNYPDPDGNEQQGWFISLVETKGDNGTELKTAESERHIPMHPELERLGFVTFAQAMLAEKRDRLFHLLTPGPYKNLTHKWGQWFGTYLRNTCGIRDKRMTFHSFRHTFTDYVRRPDIPEGIQRQLVGHSSKDVHDDYGAGYNLYWLTEAMKLYKVPGLRIASPEAVKHAA